MEGKIKLMDILKGHAERMVSENKNSSKKKKKKTKRGKK